MNIFEKIAEDKIQAALREGKFDSLPGEGKPLRLEENPFEPEEWRLALDLLRKQGFLLPWIELRLEIENELRAAQMQLGAAHGAHSTKESCTGAQNEFKETISALNRKIFDYNLRVPASQLQRPALDLEREIRAALEIERSEMESIKSVKSK